MQERRRKKAPAIVKVLTIIAKRKTFNHSFFLMFKQIVNVNDDNSNALMLLKKNEIKIKDDFL